VVSGTSSARKAIVFGISGPELTAAEADVFQRSNPAGFILFARNCIDPVQLARLNDDLRTCLDDPDPLILVDQEGGRVQRMGPPSWRGIPPAQRFAHLAEHDASAALEAAWLNARLMAHELHTVGITVDCAPVLDVPTADCHAIIGDRAYGETPAAVALFGKAVTSGLLSGGVLPVIKHLPGHGRARVDSHVSLPRVSADLLTLQRTDFAPFAALADQPCAMTAHVVYEAIDAERPATLSRTVINDVVRTEIGFDGLLFSDDICMGALSGSVTGRANAALAAGCDIVLHCNADLDEMIELADSCPHMADAATVRMCRAKAMRKGRLESFDPIYALARLEEILAI
jgi:beta-N-acetylhexosaminidase